MKFYFNLVAATAQALEDIFDRNHYADQVLQRVLKADKRRGATDRAFIAETTYDIVRFKRLFHHALKEQNAFKKVPKDVENFSIYYNYIAAWAVWKGVDLPMWREWSHINLKLLRKSLTSDKLPFAIEASIPDWLHDVGKAELPDLWRKEINAQNEPASVVLRINTLKVDPAKFKKSLKSKEVEFNSLDDNTIELKERQNVFGWEEFTAGHFEVQDAGSQQIGDFCAVAPGMRIWDACAGAGGKTLQLAAVMENKGLIIASDIHESKLQELKRRARRAGAHNIETRIIDSTKVVKKLKDSMDVVLIDAPCSGLGVLRRNPDAKWKLSQEFLDKVRNTQREVLESYASAVKPGGTLVYATCSILPSENQNQVQQFLQSEAGNGFTFQEDKTLYTHKDSTDGFYMAKLKKS